MRFFQYFFFPCFMVQNHVLLVFEGAELALDGEALGTFLDVTNDLCVDVE